MSPKGQLLNLIDVKRGTSAMQAQRYEMSIKRVAILLCVILLPILLIIHETSAFKCYICDSKSDSECTEHLPDDSKLIPQDCGNLTEAKFCIKTTNVYAGELGTKRFCASNDHGTYCNYVRQPTGDREYRSCVLTCDTELCNQADSLQSSVTIQMILPLAILLYSLAVI